VLEPRGVVVDQRCGQRDPLEPYDLAYATSTAPLALREWLEILDEPHDYSSDELDQLIEWPGKLLLLNRDTPG
jgi:hypothetical protein